MENTVKSPSEVFRNAILLGFVAFFLNMLILVPTVFGELSLLKRVLFGQVILGILTLFIFKIPKKYAITLPSLLAMVAIGLSIAQSPTPGTLKEFAAFSLIFLISIQLAALGGIKVLVLGVALFGQLTILISISTLWLVPTIALGPNQQLQGTYGHWNSLGIALVLSLPALLASKFSSSQKIDWLKITFITILFATVVATKSTSSIISFLGIVSIWLIFIIFRRSAKAGIAALSALLIFLATSALLVSPILRALGKSETLTGRVPIWKAVLDLSVEKWQTGYGWGTLFPRESDLFAQIFQKSGVAAMHSHNDLLQWFITTGFLGLLSIILSFIFLLIFGLKSYRENKNDLSLWIPLGTIGLIFAGITETVISQPQGFFILSLMSCCLGMSLGESKFVINLALRNNKSAEIPFA